MASADWTECSDGQDLGSVDRGATAGIARPNGGGAFCYGFNSLSAAEGAVGLYTSLVDFAPCAKGASIRGALQRGASGGQTGWAAFLFAGLQGPSVNDQGYLLGLGDGDPCHIVLRKGTLAGGLPDNVPGSNGVLARSSGAVPIGEWVNVRLDVIVNLNGDVVLNCYESDLDDHPVTAPDWQPIPGLAQVIDDCVGVTSGSAPLLSGRAGFGFWSEDVTRRGFVDHVVLYRQTSP